MRLLLLFLLFNAFVTSVFANKTPIEFRHLSIKDGLISNYVNTIYEDANGLIWLGTNGGLSNRITSYNVCYTKLLRENFERVIQVSEILNIDPDFRAELRQKYKQLLPYKIGAKGQLQEWQMDFKETNEHHRHLSHLYGFHPGNQITKNETPDLYKAVRKTLELRGDEATGWSMGWKINFWARMFDGNHAYKIINNLFRFVDASKEQKHGGGERIAESIVEFRNSEDNIELIKQLKKHQLQFELVEKENAGTLNDKLFVCTGTFSVYSRNEIHDLIKQNGGKVRTSISAKIDYLVAGEKAGSKLKKAEGLGITVLTEEQFGQLLIGDND